MHSSPKHVRIRPRAAFTLIELLTVIAIIGILAAIIVPTVGKVRDTAKKAECVSRLRQWGAAVMMFAADNKDFVALDASNGKAAYEKYFALKSLAMDNQKDGTIVRIGGQEAMTKCPNGKGSGVTTTLQYNFAIPFDRGDVIVKVPKADGTVNDIKSYKVSAASSPAKLLLMIEQGDGNSQIAPADASKIETEMKKVRKIQLEPTDGSESIVRHGGSANALFLDGHVSSMSLKDTDYKNADSKERLERCFRLK
jgi:prepilin-type processing-associated H-X9-DG protein/prepilin-type N-terminal cleavage/methylation domain-containing protein